MTSSPSPPPQPRQHARQKTIPNPRRLLILTPTSHSLTTIPTLLHTLTGVPVDNPPTATSPTVTSTAADTGAGTATTFAGYTTHSPLHIANKYYTAEVPIWVDEIPLPPTAGTGTSTAPGPEGTTQWKTEFSGPEARIVRDAIGGVMVCIRNLEPSSPSLPGGEGGGDVTERDDVQSVKSFLRCIGDVKRLVEEERGDVGFGEVLGVIVLVDGSGSKTPENRKRVEDEDLDTDTGAEEEEEEPFSVPWWEDQLDEIGLMDFDVVKWDSRAEEDDRRDRYGEYQGMRRIRQILETHDWSEDTDEDTDADASQLGGGGDGDDFEQHLLGLDSNHGFNLEVNELEREMLGLRMAIERGGDDGGSGSGSDIEDVEGEDIGDDEIKVESMEALMLRMQAIKDMSAELPESERKKFAAKAVGDIMKEI